MAERPFVFIGSSRERIDIAKALQANLGDGCECRLWSQGAFDGSLESYLEELVAQLPQYQFGIVLLAPDDLVTSRGAEKPAPRDNLLFELGLLVGALGRDRVMMIVDETVETKLPSDLAGIGHLKYVPPKRGDWQSALGPACYSIQQKLSKLSATAPGAEREPDELRSLREHWRRYRESHPQQPHTERFKLYSFCGITDAQESSSASPDDDLEDIYFLWADAGRGNTIQAHVLRDGDRRIQVRFDNKPHGSPASVAIRINGRNLLHKEAGFTSLRFRARIAPGGSPADLQQVQLGLRIVDALQTHWMYAKREGYCPMLVERCPADAWTDYRVDLGRSSWKVFEFDGNCLYHGDRPDFTIVQAVVVEVGGRDSLRPGPGCGAIEIKEMALD